MGLFKKVKKRAKSFHKSVARTGRLGLTSLKAAAAGDFKTAFIAGGRGSELFLSGGVSHLVRGQRGSNLGSLTTRAAGLQETSPGKFTPLNEITDKIDLRQFELNQIAIEQRAQDARDKEEKRRRRRGNIGTRPLGALVSNSLRTRVLTGQ